MASAPTYQEINAQRALAEEASNKEAQRLSAVQEAEALSIPNPVLANYMNKSTQQGLSPVESNIIGNPEQYSQEMINAAMSGQVEPDLVMEDPNILPEYKAVMQQAPVGLGNLA